MSDHKKPQPLELIQALKEHRLPHDKPSQLADSFRHGWQAALRAPAVPADALEKAKKYDHLLPYLCKTCGGFGLVDRRCQGDPLGAEPCPDCNSPAAPVPNGWRDVAELCAQMCDSRARSLLGDKQLTAGTEAKKCASVLRDPPDYWREKLNSAAPQLPDAFQTEGGLKSEIRTTKDPAFWRACDLLSMTIGTLMGFRQKLGYTDNSPIAGLVNDAVKFLEPWPEKLPTATKPPEADGRKTVSILSGKEAVFAIDILGGPMREYATGKWENAVWPSEAAPMQMPEPVAHLWQHGETGRTRVVMPDAITDCGAACNCPRVAMARMSDGTLRHQEPPGAELYSIRRV